MTTRPHSAIPTLCACLCLASLMGCPIEGTSDTDTDTGTDIDANADADSDGFSPAEGDCDDTNSAIYPGAEERCNGVDDDCNELADDGLVAVYADVDGDLYGDLSSPLDGCIVSAGRVDNSDDCDDSAAGVNPGEDEVCGNGVDENCDPTDCALPSSLNLADLGGPESVLIVGNGLNDAIGQRLAAAGDLNGDGFEDLLSVHRGSGSPRQGAVFVINGRPTDSGRINTIAEATLYSPLIGSTLSGIGDIDDDGYDDILIGGSGSNATQNAYLVRGPITGIQQVEDAATWVVTGTPENPYLPFLRSSGTRTTITSGNP